MKRFRSLRPLRAARFLSERLVAALRTTSVLARFRKRVRFMARVIDQDGVLLLMPREPSFGVWYWPLLVASTVGGAVLGALS
jgi:broad specificity phosphatase PhoE